MRRTALESVRWTEIRTPLFVAAFGGQMMQSNTGCTVVYGREAGLLHLSVSHENRYPTWDELASARDLIGTPEQRFVMVFPSHDEYVNVHQSTLHLWQVAEETEAQ